MEDDNLDNALFPVRTNFSDMVPFLDLVVDFDDYDTLHIYMFR